MAPSNCGGFGILRSIYALPLEKLELLEKFDIFEKK
jgi:hypothetical protein